MWRKQAALFIFLFLGLALFLLANKSTSEPSDSPKVAATIFPLYDITRNIAGDVVYVHLILPPGASPHTFEPSPQEIKGLQGSSAIFSIGNGIDNWSSKLAETAGITKQITVDKNIKLIDGDPHYWLSVVNAELIADQVLDELIALYPQHEQEFRENHAKYIASLQNLDQEIKVKLGSRKLQIATFHNAWKYFAQEYGVQVVATFEEFPGEEPGPAYLAEFQKEVQKSKVKVIFAEPQLSTAQLVPIASDIGTKISTLDPVGGISGRDSYLSLMHYNLENIIEANK